MTDQLYFGVLAVILIDLLVPQVSRFADFIERFGKLKAFFWRKLKLGRCITKI